MGKIIDGIKFALGIFIFFGILFGMVFAVGFHSANEILDGTFLGNYTFTGNVKYNGAVDFSNSSLSGIESSGSDISYFNLLTNQKENNLLSSEILNGYVWTFENDVLSQSNNAIFDEGYSNYGSSTSYANSGGQGDRSGIISVTSNFLYNVGSISYIVNGGSTTDVDFIGNQNVADKYISFEFDSKKVIDQAILTLQSCPTQGNWKWQGSNDGILWEDIGGSFVFGGVASFTMNSLNSNVNAFKFYRLFGISGTTQAPYLFEMNFRISDMIPTDMDIIPSPVNLDSEKTTQTIYFLHNAIDPVNLGTDLQIRVSEDNGVTWTDFKTEESDYIKIMDYDSDYKLWKVSFDTSSINGTQAVWEIKTLNSKLQKIGSVMMIWN